MRIRKNGKVISLTESDLMRITKKVLREQEESKNPKFSLTTLGFSDDQLENVLSQISKKNGYKPKEDKYGTYIFLNPADFVDASSYSEIADDAATSGKVYKKILDKLVNAELLVAKDSSKFGHNYTFGPKGKSNYQLYFKSPKRMDVN